MAKTRLTRSAAFSAALAALTVAGAAHAHAHLVTSSPAANATGPAPKQITMKFSEAPMAKLSGVELMPASGAAIPVKPVKVADRKTLAVAPDSPLQPGIYSVKWHAVAADTHRSEGTFSFTVR